MKFRSKKHRHERSYAHVIKAVNNPTSQPVSTTFSHIVENLLVKKVNPLPVLTEDNLDIVIEKRPRGRPRKTTPLVDENKQHNTHKIENDDVTATLIDHSTHKSMINDFKYHYVINKIPIFQSITRIAAAYHITYKQAYTLLENEL